MDDAVALHTAHDRACGIVPATRRGLVGTTAGGKALRGWTHAERFVRTDVVVFVAKRRQGADKPGPRRRHAGPAQPLRESAMKAFDFALGLRMADRTVDQLNALLEECNAHAGET